MCPSISQYNVLPIHKLVQCYAHLIHTQKNNHDLSFANTILCQPTIYKTLPIRQQQIMGTPNSLYNTVTVTKQAD